VESASHADGYRVAYKVRPSAKTACAFQFVILDEAHVARKQNGSIVTTLSSFQYQSLVRMTGTALYNDLQDIIGPLSLMWHSLGIEWNFEQSDLGDLAGLYHPEYDPFAKTNEVSFAGVRLVTKGLFYEYPQSNIALARDA
jgi:hypothetical protein